MPTGYTSDLQKRNFDLAKWLKESVPRSFGVLVCLRDEGSLTEDQILEKLSKNNYHFDRIEEYKEKIKHYENMSKEDAQIELDFEQHKSIKNRAERTEKFIKEKESFTVCLMEVRKLQMKAKEGLITNMLDFADEQLMSTLNHDYNQNYYENPDIVESYTVDDFICNKIDSYKHSLEYHEEALKKATEADTSRFNSYKEIVAFIDENCKKVD